MNKLQDFTDVISTLAKASPYIGASALIMLYSIIDYNMRQNKIKKSYVLFEISAKDVLEKYSKDNILKDEVIKGSLPEPDSVKYTHPDGTYIIIDYDKGKVSGKSTNPVTLAEIGQKILQQYDSEKAKNDFDFSLDIRQYDSKSGRQWEFEIPRRSI